MMIKAICRIYQMIDGKPYQFYGEGYGYGAGWINYSDGKMAYENGEREAAGILLQYYLKGDFPEASSVKRICQDIISNGDAALLPIAYYCQFRIADNREQYRDSMAYAKKYLACANAEEEKKAEVQKYLEEKEVSDQQYE